MGVESVQSARVECVENRRPSEVFMALWRYYVHGEGRSCDLEAFARLADTWAQIREIEEIAARAQRRPRFIDDLGEPDDRPKPKDPKKQGVVSIYYEVKEPGHINVAIDCPEGMSEDARQAVVRKVWAKWHAEADEGGRKPAPPRDFRSAVPPTTKYPPMPGEADTSSGAAVAVPPPPQGEDLNSVSDSVHSPEELDEEAEAEAKKARSLQLAKGFAERKRKALARVAKFRADGGTLAAIVEASGGKLTMDVLLDLVACKPQPVVTWAALEKALNKLDSAASAAGGASPSPTGGG